MTFVFDLCVKLGADPEISCRTRNTPQPRKALVASGFGRPRIQNGAPNIERADKLVQLIAKQKGLSLKAIDDQVALVDRRIAANRAKAAAA